MKGNDPLMIGDFRDPVDDGGSYRPAHNRDTRLAVQKRGNTIQESFYKPTHHTVDRSSSVLKDNEVNDSFLPDIPLENRSPSFPLKNERGFDNSTFNSSSPSNEHFKATPTTRSLSRSPIIESSRSPFLASFHNSPLQLSPSKQIPSTPSRGNSIKSRSHSIRHSEMTSHTPDSLENSSEKIKDLSVDRSASVSSIQKSPQTNYPEANTETSEEASTNNSKSAEPHLPTSLFPPAHDDTSNIFAESALQTANAPPHRSTNLRLFGNLRPTARKGVLHLARDELKEKGMVKDTNSDQSETSSEKIDNQARENGGSKTSPSTLAEIRAAEERKFRERLQREKDRKTRMIFESKLRSEERNPMCRLSKKVAAAQKMSASYHQTGMFNPSEPSASSSSSSSSLSSDRKNYSFARHFTSALVHFSSSSSRTCFILLCLLFIAPIIFLFLAFHSHPPLPFISSRNFAIIPVPPPSPPHKSPFNRFFDQLWNFTKFIVSPVTSALSQVANLFSSLFSKHSANPSSTDTSALFHQLVNNSGNASDAELLQHLDSLIDRTVDERVSKAMSNYSNTIENRLSKVEGGVEAALKWQSQWNDTINSRLEIERKEVVQLMEKIRAEILNEISTLQQDANRAANGKQNKASEKEKADLSSEIDVLNETVWRLDAEKAIGELKEKFSELQRSFAEQHQKIASNTETNAALIQLQSTTLEELRKELNATKDKLERAQRESEERQRMFNQTHYPLLKEVEAKMKKLEGSELAKIEAEMKLNILQQLKDAFESNPNEKKKNDRDDTNSVQLINKICDAFTSRVLRDTANIVKSETTAAIQNFLKHQQADREVSFSSATSTDLHSASSSQIDSLYFSNFQPVDLPNVALYSLGARVIDHSDFFDVSAAVRERLRQTSSPSTQPEQHTTSADSSFADSASSQQLKKWRKEDLFESDGNIDASSTAFSATSSDQLMKQKKEKTSWMYRLAHNIAKRKNNYDPNIVLQGTIPLPGDCYPLKGRNGYLTVDLSAIRPVKAVTLGHIPQAQDVHKLKNAAAPKNFTATCLCYELISERGRCARPTESLDEEKRMELEKIKNNAIASGKFFVYSETIVSDSYNTSGRPFQTFGRRDGKGTAIRCDSVRFNFESNHGNLFYTSIYRLFVHPVDE
ncbi:SUN domain containing protein [Monocercomonoides exilis]|uniref:SUN domain containing protein n=1 Tax=Monocercomonoides exilis TaxID=2049356 RepID=UPI003559DA09|nr:SUN domain containing protein [Monocercomonoides exilis]|eukprot:MONOS_15561.1-p1 / transcript=MONOS_15561.1 / gene=MONOS_15561 / organism=Monocercomonoides_exilis_PA203 / gene_product=SUN domain containing protein / transcript_product=SUN domain containing protein / location=Mono_scaffold01272:4815-8783(+) / protein_length=1147 / sequence_SO=supercontig / SO=protein_coding / is_pseudo=false